MKLVKSSLVGVSTVGTRAEMAWTACSPTILPWRIHSRTNIKEGLVPESIRVSTTIWLKKTMLG